MRHFSHQCPLVWNWQSPPTCHHTWVLGIRKWIDQLCLWGVDNPIRETGRQCSQHTRKNKRRLIVGIRQKALWEEQKDGLMGMQLPNGLGAWSQKGFIVFSSRAWVPGSFCFLVPPGYFQRWMRWPLFWEANFGHGKHHELGRKVAGGAENPPNLSWYLSRLACMLHGKVAEWLNLPFLALFLAMQPLSWVLPSLTRPRLERREQFNDNGLHSLLRDSNDSRENNDKFLFPLNKELCAKLVFDGAWKKASGY